jgi:4-hydroxybenzoate polyprenyltransferase
LHEYIAHIFVSNGAVFVELYTIYYASTSKLSVLMLLPRYAALSSLFAQIFILFYSPHLREYFTYSFVLNGAVFIELFTIYYAITGADKKKQTSATLHVMC